MRPLTTSPTVLAEIADERFHHPSPKVQRRMEVLWLAAHGLPRADVIRLSGGARERPAIPRRLIGESLEYNPMKERLGTLVTFQKRNGEWYWILRKQVAAALERLGWVEGTAILLPEELEATKRTLIEGAIYRVAVNAYERSQQARQQCIAAHGIACTVCGFSFGAAYGEVADGYIHVHHLRPLSEIGGEYSVNPVEDLRPVCPNCHAVLHRRIPAYCIEEVQAFLQGRVLRAVHPIDVV